MPDHYFATDNGEYLGKDNASSDSVRVINRNKWKSVENNRTTGRDSSVLRANSSLMRNYSNMTQELFSSILTNIYKNKNFADLPIDKLYRGKIYVPYEMYNDAQALTTRGTDFLVVMSFRFNQYSSGDYENIWDWVNSIIHEWRHYKQVVDSDVRKEYEHTRTGEETDATRYQVRHSSWLRVSNSYRFATWNRYGKYLSVFSDTEQEQYFLSYFRKDENYNYPSLMKPETKKLRVR